MIKMSATELVDSHKKSIFVINERKLKSVTDSFLSISPLPPPPPQKKKKKNFVDISYVYSANIKKLCLPCSQKPPDKCRQALVGWHKGTQFIYRQLFVVIGMVDL